MKKTKLDEVIDQDGTTDNSVKQLAELATPFLIHAFHQGIEGLTVVRLSIQSARDGTFRGTLSGVYNADQRDESGVVAYTRADTVGDVLEFFEFGLAYDDLDWRVDKYHKNSKSTAKISRQGKEKRKLI